MNNAKTIIKKYKKIKKLTMPKLIIQKATKNERCLLSFIIHVMFKDHDNSICIITNFSTSSYTTSFNILRKVPIHFWTKRRLQYLGCYHGSFRKNLEG